MTEAQSGIGFELFTVDFICGTFSLLGSYLIITTFGFHKHLQEFPYSLVFYLALCDFCFSGKFFLSAFFIPFYPNPCADLPGDYSDGFLYLCSKEQSVCYFSSLWTQFWALGTISWNGMVSLNLILSLRNPFVYTAGYEKLYHIYVWSLSFLMTFLMAISGATCADGCNCRWWGFRGHGDFSCWISTQSFAGQLSFFAPLFTSFILGLLSLFVSLKRTKNVFGDDSIRRGVLIRQTVYVFAFMIIWSGPIVNRGYRVFFYFTRDCNEICVEQDCKTEVGNILTITDEFCMALQGFVNSVIWLSHPYFKNRLRVYSRINSCFSFLSSCLCCDCGDDGGTGDGSDATIPEKTMIEENIQDFNRIAAFLRKYFILFMAYGITASVENIDKIRARDKSERKTQNESHAPVELEQMQQLISRVFTETVEFPHVVFPIGQIRQHIRQHRRELKEKRRQEQKLKQKQNLNKEGHQQQGQQGQNQEHQDQKEKSIFSAAAERLLSITSNVDPLAPHSFSFVSSSSNTKTWDEEGGKERLSRKDLDVLEEDDENEIEEEDDENQSSLQKRSWRVGKTDTDIETEEENDSQRGLSRRDSARWSDRESSRGEEGETIPLLGGGKRGTGKGEGKGKGQGKGKRERRMSQQGAPYSNISFHFTDFAPRAFSKLRELDGISSEEYCKSMDPEGFAGLVAATGNKFSEGRSGSFFCFTPDKKFILKTISEMECLLLREIIPSYFDHLCTNPNSLLVRFYGCHAILIPNTSRNLYFVVMNNVFRTNKKMHKRYDLKGSWVRRCVGEAHQLNPEKVLGMDLDLKQKINIGEEKSKELCGIIKSDSLFLKSIGLIDYSLLIGIHEIRNQNALYDSTDSDWVVVPKEGGLEGLNEELKGKEKEPSKDILTESQDKESHGVWSTDHSQIFYFGIIDFLQRYDVGKKAERFTKVVLLQKDSKGISVQNPSDYQKRFEERLTDIFE